MRANRLAKIACVPSARTLLYRVKTSSVENVVRIAPGNLSVDSFQMKGRRIVGIGMAGVGQLHLTLDQMSSSAQLFVRDQLIVNLSAA